jgi:SPP1 gp7 family putative phage head morphogenesis protein
MVSMYGKIGQETLDNVSEGFSTKASEQFFTSEEAKKRLEDRAQFFIQSMLNTDYEELKDVIVAGMKDGAGVDVIGRNIRKYFDDMSVARAKTIARTETGRLVSQATNEAYNQSAIITGKEWLTAGDDRVRDEHVLNAGVIVNSNGTFPSGEHYPGEATINCRCVLAPAI